MKKLLRDYYENDARKLRGVVDSILTRFGGIAEKDYDDFYSLANEVFVDVMRRYDGAQSFEGFLYACLLNKIKSEITKRNRYKRSAERLAISIDMPIGDGEDATLADVIEADFDLDKEIAGIGEEDYSRKMQLYLSKLSHLQREVLTLTSDGYLPGEICKKLCITERQYSECNVAIHSYRNVSVLF